MSDNIRTYRFKLVPNKEQEQTFVRWLGTTRFIYNLGLEYKTWAYKANGTSITKNQMQKEITEIRAEYPWVEAVQSQVLQDTTDRLFKAYDAFFDRVKQGKTPGFPKFKNRNTWDSFKFKQGIRLHGQAPQVYLPKIGWVRFFQSQEVQGVVKTCDIKREGKDWFMSLACEFTEEQMEGWRLAPNGQIVGFDLGLIDLLTTSDGEVKENLRLLAKAENKMKKIQRRLSRKQKGSNNRKKVKYDLAQAHRKVARIRKDHLHKVSTQIVRENQVIICEKLNIQNMAKRAKPKQDEHGTYLPNNQAAKSGLNKSILDAGWGMLISMVEYKAAWRGRTFIQVNPAYTSQDCSICGHRNSELKLMQREWECLCCGTLHNRDVNAADNIKNDGLVVLESELESYRTGGGSHLLHLKYIGDILSTEQRSQQNGILQTRKEAGEPTTNQRRRKPMKGRVEANEL